MCSVTGACVLHFSAQDIRLSCSSAPACAMFRDLVAPHGLEALQDNEEYLTHAAVAKPKPQAKAKVMGPPLPRPQATSLGKCLGMASRMQQRLHRAKLLLAPPLADSISLLFSSTAHRNAHSSNMVGESALNPVGVHRDRHKFRPRAVVSHLRAQSAGILSTLATLSCRSLWTTNIIDDCNLWVARPHLPPDADPQSLVAQRVAKAMKQKDCGGRGVHQQSFRPAPPRMSQPYPARAHILVVHRPRTRGKGKGNCI